MPEASVPRLVTITPDISLVVSDVPSSTYNTEALEPRLGDLDWVSLAGAAHHKVVDSLVNARITVLPFRLFTIFSNEAKAIETIAGKRRSLREAFKRVRGREEWVLRIGKPDPARSAPTEAGAQARESGTNFLQAKAEARREAVARAERVRTDAMAAVAALERLADATRTRTVDPAGNVLTDAAFLVPEGRVEEMRSALTKAAAGLLRDGCPVSLTGPWPPYSFASVDAQDDG